MSNKKVGQIILKSRKDKNLTQQDLAALLHVTDKTVSKWENDRGLPDISIIPSLCDILGIPINQFTNDKLNKQDVEVEIKIRLTEKEFLELKKRVSKVSIYKKTVHQIDDYYTSRYRDFTKEDYPYEWLSIRDRGNRVILNYKHWYPENTEKSIYCDEYEVELDDKERMHKIFEAIGIIKFCTVNKNREVYILDNKYEFSLDNVEGLGYFVEIEVKKYDLSPIEEYKKLLCIVDNFNLNIENIDRRGYPYYFINSN